MNIRPIFPKIFVIICLVGALSLFVKPASGAGDPDETTDFSFLEGMALVVLEDGSVPALHEARQLIESYGGRIAIMSPPSMLIGWIPFELREELIGFAGIEDIYFTEVPAGEVRTAGAPDRAMVSWFNAVTTGEIRQRMESDQRPGLDNSPGAPQTPRKPDMRIPPAFDKVSFLENMESVGLDVQALKERGLYPDGTAAYGGNSLAMTGTIALSIFFVESDGSGTDPDQYTWTEEDMQKYLDHAATGMTWWASRAASQTGCFATFLLYYYSADDPRCQQWVEPVLHDTSYEADWVEAIMSNFGYTSGNRWSMVDAFNTWQRSTYQTARAYSAFICYNPFPSPQSFPDDHTAYAWYYGPYFVSLFRTGWTPSQTFTHETGHIFGACDEYAGGCGSGSCTSVCANDVLNVNCEVCNSKSVACMMKANTWSLCAYTPGQLGWEIVPCTPAAPPALPAPTVAASLPASMYQGLDGTVTVTGTHFYAGAWVKFGPEVFVHKTTLVGTETLIVDVTVFNDAPPGLYNITVKNRDFQSATLTNALEVLATTRHYFSPSGANNFPYITPADAATDLADAVDAAYQGDTLMVPSMTLNNFSMTLEKGVLLHGAWNADFSSRDLAAGKTVLNLAGDISLFPGADQGGLDGFVIENGTGLPVIVPFNGDVGGGIRVINTNAIIANCEIRNNAATGGTTLGAGGGIYADGAVVDIRDNYIHDNTATWGGGMYLYNCSGTVSNNTVSGNTVRATTDPPQGAGIYLADCDGIVLDGNTIDTNTGATDGGGLLVNNGSGTVVSGGSISRNSCTYLGGGVGVRSSDITLTDVLLERNRGVLGGGIGASDTTDVVATVCRFNWNNATIGGGIYAAGENLNLDFNLFVGNSSVGTGGGALVSGFTTGSVAGNTFDRNAGGAACGGLAVSNSAIELFNNIVVNSTGHGIAISGAASPWIGYNHVWNSSGENYNGTVAGDGATTGDPAFADTSSMDYHLGAHSPSIDSGRPGVAWQDPDGSRGDQGWYGSHIFEMDQPAYPRDLTAALEAGDVVLRWTGNSEPDLGQYAVYSDITPDFKPSVSNFLGFTAAGDTSASFGAPPDSVWYVVAALDLDGYESGFSDRAFVGTATGVETARIFRNQLSQNVPNPFNPVTRIRYELGRTAHVTLSVYDVAGRMVRQLENGSVPPGIYTAVWDGTNENGAAVSSGIYFYRLQAGDFSHTRKMLLLK